MLSLLTFIAQDLTETFGTVEPPEGVKQFNIASGGETNIGLLLFITRLTQVFTIIAGIFVMFNFIMAGYIYITSSGDSSAHGKVKDKITMSILGLIIIVAAYTITALLGLFLAGDAGFFLNPTIPGPSTGPTL